MPRPGRIVAVRNSGLVPAEVAARFSVTMGWPLISVGSAEDAFALIRRASEIPKMHMERRRMRPRLVPIRNRVEVIRTMICVTVLNRHLEILLEGNRRIKMKAVDAPL